MRLDTDMGSMAYDDIIAGTEPAALITTIKLAASQGVLERGTIVTGTPGGEFSACSKTTSGGETGFILAEDTDTGTGSAVVAYAYKTGCFFRDRLKTDGSYVLTDADWDKLRGIGIMTEDTL